MSNIETATAWTDTATQTNDGSGHRVSRGVKGRQVRRHRLVLAFFVVALPLTFASAAFACQTLATLHPTPRTAVAGVETTLTITGNSFDPRGSEVQIRLDTLNSRETLAIVQASGLDLGGAFTVPVVIPSNLKVGYHFLVATQRDVNGNLAAGTPVRASFQVLPASASPSAVPFGPGHPHEGGHPNTTRSSVMNVTTLASPFGLAALVASSAIGLVLSRRRTRTF